MSLKEFANLWETVTTYRQDKKSQKEKFRRFKQLLESSDVVKAKGLTQLFKQKIEPYCNVTELCMESFECFKSAFVIVNEYLNNISDVVLLKMSEKDFPSRFERLKITDSSGLEEDGDFQFQVDAMPAKLEGYKTLWRLARLAKNEEVAKKARNLLVYLHMSLNTELLAQIKEIREEYLKICFEYLRKLRLERPPKYQILRCFGLIHALIDMSHMAGKQDNLKRPRLHCELNKGKLFTIKVEHNVGSWKQETIKVYSNTLVCDLFSKCMEQFGLGDDSEIYLEEVTQRLVIDKLSNTRTISSLGIQNNAYFELKARSPLEAYLIQHDDTLNPKAKEIFTEWFDNYSDNGKMNAEQCTAFVSSFKIDMMRFNETRIKELFDELDDDKDSHLTLNNILGFYFKACKHRKTAVWNNLSAHKINRCLKKQKLDKCHNGISSTCNVISLISSNNDYLNVLFSLLEIEGLIAFQASELLNRLPTNPQIFSDIVLLKGIKNIPPSQNPDWSHIFDESNYYKLLYCLSIVEYLVDEKRLDNDDDIGFWSMHPKLLSHKKTWFSNFRGHGGLECLDRIIGNLR